MLSTPSGLFPFRPSRPTYREPHPVRASAAVVGGLAAGLWLLTFGLLGRDLSGFLWGTFAGGLSAWVVALVLALVGDRGVAAGIAVAVGVGLSLCTVVLATAWAVTGDWPLW
ncbi:MAG TPA: hypothetical protein VF174_11940 [Micromonosporaceae bacterium]